MGLGLALIATPVLAAPGDPLGGGHAGCAPDGAGLGCGRKIDGLLAKLRARLVNCHINQASDAFYAGMGTAQMSADEDACAATAKTKFDDPIADLAAAGCDSTQIANANARRDIILSDQTVSGSVDNLNSTFFCDSSSGNLIDAGGDDGGYVPSTKSHLKCGVVVAKGWGKLHVALSRCHYKLAAAVMKDKPFDPAACETTGRSSASERYLRGVMRYIDDGLCPPCLADTMMSTNAVDLGAATITASDTEIGDVYICPAP
jgi:hypothetical protein